MECLDESLDNVITIIAFYVCGPHRFNRTSNHIECLKRELKRRSNAIGVFSNIESIIRVMSSVLIEYREKTLSVPRLYRGKTIKDVKKASLSFLDCS